MIGFLAALGTQTGTTPDQPCVVHPTGVQGICTAAHSLHIPVEYHSILPELILIGGALVILMVSALLPKRQRRGLWSGLTVVVGLASLGASIWLWNRVVDDKKALITIGNALEPRWLRSVLHAPRQLCRGPDCAGRRQLPASGKASTARSSTSWSCCRPRAP